VRARDLALEEGNSEHSSTTATASQCSSDIKLSGIDVEHQ
jgi:hypothetical protein